MLIELTNFLRGKVSLHIVSAFPERVINLCAARGIALWEVHWESPTSFSCTLSRQSHARLRRAAKNLDCEISTLHRAGLPFLMGRARRRRTLLAGFCLCLALLFFGSFFIWDFEIEGQTAVPDERILRSLQKNGVCLGSFGLNVDSEVLRNHVLLEIPELSWIAVNVSGCRAHVQVRPRIAPPVCAKRSPQNLIAARDGLILSVQTLWGDPQVLPGTTVSRGDLLISGVSDTDTFGARLVAGRGTVTARTWHRLTVSMPLCSTKKEYTGREKHRYAIDFGTKRIKFYGNASISQPNYDKISTRSQWQLPAGLALPISWVKESYRPYTPVSVPITPTQAEEAGRAILEEYLRTQLAHGGTISSTLVSSRQVGERLKVTLTAECVEEIGRAAEISTEKIS